MNNFKDNWLELVRRCPGFFSLLLVGMVLSFFIGSSLLCKINYSAGVIRGMKVAEMKTIHCNAVIVDYRGVTNYSYDKLSFWVAQQEVHIQAWDRGTCHQLPSSWYQGVSTIDSITLYDFQYPDKACIDSNKASTKAEMQELYDEVKRTGVSYFKWQDEKKKEFEERFNK